jgi:Protein kinase domain/PEGA domain
VLHFINPALRSFRPLTRDDQNAFAPPPAFGPFRVLHQIGVGALGPVFRTYEPTRDRLVAIKVFRLDITPEQSQSLADELAAAAEAGLFHPSIVEPIASGVEGTVAYRAEEYVAAESLDVAMRHYAPAPPEKVLPFITQLAGAIDFARTAGVGHGALHPRDVFLTPDEARATGFGVVEALERVGLRAPVRRPYSAPERVAGAAWSTPADVFSLAAIAYEMLTGRRPAGTGAQIGAVTGERGEALHQVLVRAMDDSPARRYPTALAFASAFDAAARSAAPVRPSSQAVVAPFPVPPVAGTSRIQDADVPAAPADVVDISPAARAPEVDILGVDAYDAPDDFVDEELNASLPAEADFLGDSDLDLPLDDAPIAEPVRGRVADDVAPKPAAGARQDRLFSVDDRVDHLAEEAFAASAMADDRVPERETLSYAADSEERSGWSPLAVVLFSILLMGVAFAAGYVVRDRALRSGSGATVSDTAAVSGDAGGKTAPGTDTAKPETKKPEAREFSDEKVADPAARGATPPPAVSEPSAPAAAPAPVTRPAATTGRLVIRSTPAGAAVTLNGRWRGRTPLTVEKLPFRTYAVNVSQAGFTSARESVSLTASDPTQTVNLQLERKAAAAPAAARRPTREAPEPPTPLGSLYIDSRPRGARVFVDGKPMGVTPVSVPDLRSGSHVVRMELPDHRPWTTSARVRAGEQERVSGSLELIK